MHLADEIATFVEFSGGVLAVVGLLIALVAAAQGVRSPVSTEAEVAPTRIGSSPDLWLAASELPFVHKRASGE